jgi:hypothetical protein
MSYVTAEFASVITGFDESIERRKRAESKSGKKTVSVTYVFCGLVNGG